MILFRGVYSVHPGIPVEPRGAWGKLKALIGRGLTFYTCPCLECPSTGEGPERELDQQLPPVPVITGSRGRCLCMGAPQPDNSLCWRGHVASHVTWGCFLPGSLPICSLGSFWVIRRQSKSSQAASFMARDYEH